MSSLPSIINANFVRISFVTTTIGGVAQVNFDYTDSVPGSVTPTEMASLAAAFNATNQATLVACLSPQTTLNWLYMQELRYATCPSLQVNYSGGTIGTAGATALPLEVAARITKYSTLKGRHGRGSLQMPAIPNTFVTPATDPSVLNAAAITAYGSVRASLLIPLVVGGRTFNLAIGVRPITPLTLYTYASQVSSLLLRTTLSTQRRRRIGRGI
jgi:hypothetical protein